jgi:FemAB-related protein (PEP-CTERM system-associated)
VGRLAEDIGIMTALSMKMCELPGVTAAIGESLPRMIGISQEPGEQAWDAYATGHRAALYSHAFGWGENLATAYGLPICRLAAVNLQTNRISGLLPLLLFSPPGRDRRLISLPYTDAAGILADDEAAHQLLVLAALELAGEHGATHLELRQAGEHPGCPEGSIGDWNHSVHHFKTGLRRTLTATTADLWSDLSAKVRNQVRKARRSGCLATVGGEELLADFYAVFSENMRDLGSPVHAPELFQQLVRCRSLRTAVIVVYLAATPVAAAIVLRQGTTLYNPWAASLRRYRPACPNMLLYWTMLEHAVASGCDGFDFGRSSPAAATCRFKRQWGARLEPLAWQVFSRGAQCWNPRNETLEDEAWKSMDLERSRREGPPRRRWISL